MERLGDRPGNAELPLRILVDIHSATQFSHSLVSEWSFVRSLTLAATSTKPKRASGYRNQKE